MDIGTQDPVHERVTDETTIRLVAIAALGAIALIHVLQAPAAFELAGYLGGLFVAAVVAAVLLAAALAVTGDRRALLAAGGLAALILLCYILSRTTGLPAVTEDVGEWTEPLGLASMVAEGLLITMTAALATAGAEAPIAVSPARSARRPSAPIVQ
jgi:hypothetical protein